MNKNRAELHLHTKLSNDISVIGVNEIFEKAEEYGLSAVAFTNLNNVQDFTNIAQIDYRKKTNLKIIYGAEVFYESDDGTYGLKLTLLAKNQAGIKELYKVISSLYDDGDCELIDLDVLKQNRKNLLVGSGGYDGDLFYQISLGKSGEALERIAAFYDYFEIFPARNEKDKEINKKIAELGEALGVLVVASNNPHYLEKDDGICCDIVRVSRGCKSDIDNKLYLRKTEEMLNEFSYLGVETAKAVVISNPQIIADLNENVSLIKGYYGVQYEKADEELESLCYDGACEKYGAFVHETVFERLNTELDFIKKNNFSSEYLTAHRIAKFVKDNGHLCGARGMAGSSLTAFLLGITDINPLPPHYYCAKCKYFEQSDSAKDGLDLPDKVCPGCGAPLNTDGHDIPFETFMGLKGDKMPDFHITISSKARSLAMEYVAERFGKDKIALPGILSTYFERTAEVMVIEYEGKTDTRFAPERRREIIKNLIGVKSHEGIYPSGIMIIPQNMEFEDFTPLNKYSASYDITHFDFHNLHDTILKINILGNAALDFLEVLYKETGVSPSEVNIKDPQIYSFFNLGDTTGLSDYEYEIVREMLLKINPQSFSDLVKVSGFAHGTNVWIDNGEQLIKNGIPISKIPTVRDDIMNDLMSIGVEKSDAYKMSEATRKGLIAKNKISSENIELFEEISKPLGDWYFDYCAKVHYMFPKAHAVFYVTNALRCAWFKKYYPEQFRKAYMEHCFEK